jgi:hypothetical protein
MYTGTLIDELMNAVQRAERRAFTQRSQEEKLAYWYAVAQQELARFDSQLVEAA